MSSTLLIYLMSRGGKKEVVCDSLICVSKFKIYMQENPQYAKLRSKGLPFAHQLTILFKDVVAIGQLEEMQVK